MSKHIYIYSPSGAVRDKATLRRGVRRLEAMGHTVEVDQGALSAHQRFAGDDAMRLAAIQRAARSGADMAMITRGGYGLTRILASLDYKSIERALADGMHFVGLSDFTAFQLAVLARLGGVTWAGPSVCEALGGEGEPDEIMLACLDDLLQGQGEGAGWCQPKETPELTGASARFHARRLGDAAAYGVKDAPLWGGNLSVLCALVGTPFCPVVDGGILFLEDVAEHPYRIERMLTQLLLSGILARQKAIVLGQFTGYQLGPHDRGFKFSTVVNWLRSQLKVPVLCNLPFGHGPTKVLLPVGARVDLWVQGRDALLAWGHLDHPG